MMFKKRPSVSLPKKDENPAPVPALTVESKEDEAKRVSFSSKLRLSLSFKGKPSSSASLSSSSLLSSADNGPGSSKATPDNPHPYENIDSLPDRSRAQSRKSVTWKDPDTNDINVILRARAKSVKDRDGRRVSLTWDQSPMKKS